MTIIPQHLISPFTIAKEWAAGGEWRLKIKFDTIGTLADTQIEQCDVVFFARKDTGSVINIGSFRILNGSPINLTDGVSSVVYDSDTKEYVLTKDDNPPVGNFSLYESTSFNNFYGSPRFWVEVQLLTLASAPTPTGNRTISLDVQALPDSNTATSTNSRRILEVLSMFNQQEFPFNGKGAFSPQPIMAEMPLWDIESQNLAAQTPVTTSFTPSGSVQNTENMPTASITSYTFTQDVPFYTSIPMGLFVEGSASYINRNHVTPPKTTFSTDDINGGTNSIQIIGHGFFQGDRAIYSREGGSFNIGIPNGRVVYITVVDDDNIKLDTTRGNNGLGLVSGGGETHSLERGSFAIADNSLGVGTYTTGTSFTFRQGVQISNAATLDFDVVTPGSNYPGLIEYIGVMDEDGGDLVDPSEQFVAHMIWGEINGCTWTTSHWGNLSSGSLLTPYANNSKQLFGTGLIYHDPFPTGSPAFSMTATLTGPNSKIVNAGTLSGDTTEGSAKLSVYRLYGLTGSSNNMTPVPWIDQNQPTNW